MSQPSVLSEGIGYFILLGVGLIMALIVTLLVKAETKWLGTKKTFEWFYTAGRTVKTGIIAASVVSAWTWAATFLQSSTVAYQFGVSGPFWYAAGASIQVVLFAIIAIELKRKAPTSHTFPEIIYVRFGKQSHKVFLSFALMTNAIVTAMLVLGGAAVVNSLTGVNIYIAAFLIPVGVIIYTFFGGLKATFFADYLNSAFIFIVVLIFVTTIYFIHPEIGGASGMFDKLSSATALHPVGGNSGGAYLTMASVGAIIFGIINIVGNFGTVFVDQAYWQRAIAARPRAAVKGFLVGGLAWFAIPFALATTLGLGAVAIGISLTPEQIEMGLVAPTAAAKLLGDVGAILLITMIFTAVTSAGSAELVSVSSLITYDVYRTYVKPSSTGRDLLRISRITIISFGIGMGILATILLQIGVSLQYVYLAMGVIIGSAVAPIALAVIWKKTSRIAATSAAIAGLTLGVTSWLLSANLLFGEISLRSTGQNIPLLIGNIVAITVGALVSLIGSLVKPENFSFDVMKQRILVVDDRVRAMIEHDSDAKFLKKAARFSYRYAFALTLGLVVVWPLPLYFSGYIFSAFVYRVWVGIAIVWAVSAAAVVIFTPIIEARRGILEVVRRIGTLGLFKMQGGREDHDDHLLEHNLSPGERADAGAGIFEKRVLVAIDGSVESLKALNYAASIISATHATRLYLLHIIEWADVDNGEEEVDEKMALQMQEEGRRMLKSVLTSKQTTKNTYERIVKLGDPSSKIIEVANKLDVDMIIMGRRGLGCSPEGLGRVSRSVLKAASQPLVLIK